MARGTITVRTDEYRYPWYRDDGRHCPFSGYLLDKLVEQGYARWDSMIKEPQGLLVVRDDGVSAVKLEDKGRALHKRLSAGRVLDGRAGSVRLVADMWPVGGVRSLRLDDLVEAELIPAFRWATQTPKVRTESQKVRTHEFAPQ